MQSLALLRAGHNPCQRREMTVSTNNGLVNGPVHNLLMQFFTKGSSKIEVFEIFETCFFDIVTTQNDHPRYVKHVIGCINLFFTLFGHWVRGGGSPKGLVHNLLMEFFNLGRSKIEVFEITSQRLLDQSQAGVYMGKTPHTPPFGPIRVPYPKGLNC